MRYIKPSDLQNIGIDIPPSYQGYQSGKFLLDSDESGSHVGVWIEKRGGVAIPILKGGDDCGWIDSGTELGRKLMELIRQ